jgi:hypothetical protein
MHREFGNSDRDNFVVTLFTCNESFLPKPGGTKDVIDRKTGLVCLKSGWDILMDSVATATGMASQNRDVNFIKIINRRIRNGLVKYENKAMKCTAKF